MDPGQRRLYSWRGAAGGVLDYYDIAANTSVSSVTVWGMGHETFTTGTCHDNADRGIILTQKGATGRFFALEVVNQLTPRATLFYPQGAAIVGDRLFTIEYTDGAARLQWVYFIASTLKRQVPCAAHQLSPTRQSEAPHLTRGVGLSCFQNLLLVPFNIGHYRGQLLARRRRTGRLLALEVRGAVTVNGEGVLDGIFAALHPVAHLDRSGARKVLRADVRRLDPEGDVAPGRTETLLAQNLHAEREVPLARGEDARAVSGGALGRFSLIRRGLSLDPPTFIRRCRFRHCWRRRSSGAG